MKAAKLREQTTEELTQAARDLANGIASLKIKRGIGEKPASARGIRNMRRDLARIKTILSERRRREASGNG